MHDHATVFMKIEIKVILVHLLELFVLQSAVLDGVSCRKYDYGIPISVY